MLSDEFGSFLTAAIMSSMSQHLIIQLLKSLRGVYADTDGDKIKQYIKSTQLAELCEVILCHLVSGYLSIV